MGISGVFYDGVSSRTRKARLFFVPETGLLRVETEDGLLCAEALRSCVKLAPPLGDAARTFTFPCGGVFEAGDGAEVAALEKMLGGGTFWRMVHGLESRWPLALLAFFLVAGLVSGAFHWGIPVLSRQIAYHFLPPDLLDRAGEQTLETLDQVLFSPSERSPEAQEEIAGLLAPLLRKHPEVRLFFRRGNRLGANALALPGGRVVVTDELLGMCQDNPEGLEGVVAHEIGHGVHRHAERRVIQDAFFSFLVMGLTGDASGVAELFMGLPILMTEMAYSRTFEREADAYALKWLVSRGKDADGFIRLLARIGEEKGEGRPGWRGYLSTHPLLEERVAALKSAP